MGYLHINNLYKDQTILMFKECYAMEKIHGTSAHIFLFKHPEHEIDEWGNKEPVSYSIKYSSGGEKHERFVSLFDEATLINKFKEIGVDSLTIYGEAYGGKQQKMSNTYGKELKFVVFDVKINDSWVNVLNAQQLTKQLGLEFVSYNRIFTDLDSINKERDLDSVQAVRNGVGEVKKREGIVLRPLEEFQFRGVNNRRVIAKHKRDDFRETKTEREVLDPSKIKILGDAKTIAEEWVTEMRLTHILDKIKNVSMRNTGEIIKNMQDDVEREGQGEIIWTKEAKKSVGQRTVYLLKNYFNKPTGE